MSGKSFAKIFRTNRKLTKDRLNWLLIYIVSPLSALLLVIAIKAVNTPNPVVLKQEKITVSPALSVAFSIPDQWKRILEKPFATAEGRSTGVRYHYRLPGNKKYELMVRVWQHTPWEKSNRELAESLIQKTINYGKNCAPTPGMFAGFEPFGSEKTKGYYRYAMTVIKGQCARIIVGYITQESAGIIFTLIGMDAKQHDTILNAMKSTRLTGSGRNAFSANEEGR